MLKFLKSFDETIVSFNRKEILFTTNWLEEIKHKLEEVLFNDAPDIVNWKLAGLETTVVLQDS